MASIGDTGVVLNPEASASPYSSGLDGVDQSSNWLVSNISICTFFVLLTVVLGYRVVHHARSELRLVLSLRRESDQRYWMRNHSHFWAALKTHLINAPLGKTRHNRALRLSSAISNGTLPGRLHTLLLFLYASSNFIYCLALHWHTADTVAITAELRGRSGQLAALNLIPTVLFALRNNPLLWLTGVSYDTFNLFHRWAARIVVVESVIHTACWAANNLRSGGQPQVDAGLSSSISFQWGMVAMVMFSVIFIIALSPIRHAFYETFLHSHRLLVLIGLVGVYVHLDRAHLPQVGYIQFVVLLYTGELLIRFGRICYLNVSKRTGMTEVTVEAMPEEACRVTFKLRRPWRYRPGCHVHAHLPAVAPMSSHPFSIAWAEEVPRMTFETEKGQSTSESATVDSIGLICRARSGFTRKLYNKAMAAQGKRFSTWGFVEGPYGGYHSFESYGTVLIFAGGVGVTHCLGHVQHLLKRWQQGTCATQRILLVWSVPNTECLEWVRMWMDDILKMNGRRDVLRIQLFVTKPRHRGEVVSRTGSVQMLPGRCDPTTIIAREMEQRIGAMAVTVCGPGAFADSVRSATRAVMEEGCVDLVEEAFTY